MFITFEGGEGCGKSTQSKMLYEYLLSKGIDAILTREIGGTEVGEQIRDIVVNQELKLLTELLLVMAARNEHLLRIIIPALEANKWVICDRYIDSTACYQSNCWETMDDIYNLHEYILGDKSPDKTIIIHVPVEIALARTTGRKGNNKFEAKPIEFHRRIYSKFLQLQDRNPARIIDIDAKNLTAEEVHSEILKHLKI